jgi:protein-disulfide isomerase
MSVSAKREAARQRIAARRAAEAAARASARHRQRTVVGGVVTVVVLVLALVVVFVVQSHRTSAVAGSAVPPGTTDGGYAVAVGATDAPVTVDVYEDFQCPVCRRFESSTGSTLDQLVADGTVQVRYHGMAFLDTSANDHYSTRALDAAAVVLAHAGADAYGTFHDLLFANQPAEGGRGLSDDQLIAYADQAGATGDAVAQGIREQTYADWTAQATEQASKDGVTATPTVLVDGDRVTDLSATGLTAAVNAARTQ